MNIGNVILDGRVCEAEEDTEEKRIKYKTAIQKRLGRKKRETFDEFTKRVLEPIFEEEKETVPVR